MNSLSKENIIERTIVDVYKSLDDYEFEVALNDAYLIYRSKIKKEFNIKRIFITQQVCDYGIDSIVQDNANELHLQQISKNRKGKRQLEGFLNDGSLKKYNDIIGDIEINKIQRNLITMENSKNINDVNMICDKSLLEVIKSVWSYLQLDETNYEKYINNIQISTLYWELINSYRKKQRFDLVKKYSNLMLANYYSIINRHFCLPTSLKEIEDFNFDALLDIDTDKSIIEKKKMKLLFKSKIVYDGIFSSVYSDVENLIVYLLKLIDFNFNKYEIVPRCKYISVKLKENSKVIAYFNYDYNKIGAKSYVFGYKCTSDDLKKEPIVDSRILEKDGKKIADACSFKTPIFFAQPNLISDKNILDDLFRLSEQRVNCKGYLV